MPTPSQIAAAKKKSQETYENANKWKEVARREPFSGAGGASGGASPYARYLPTVNVDYARARARIEAEKAIKKAKEDEEAEKKRLKFAEAKILMAKKKAEEELKAIKIKEEEIAIAIKKEEEIAIAKKKEDEIIAAKKVEDAIEAALKAEGDKITEEKKKRAESAKRKAEEAKQKADEEERKRNEDIDRYILKVREEEEIKKINKRNIRKKKVEEKKVEEKPVEPPPDDDYFFYARYKDRVHKATEDKGGVITIHNESWGIDEFQLANPDMDLSKWGISTKWQVKETDKI